MKGLKLEYYFFVVDGANRNILLGDDFLTTMMMVRVYYDLGLIKIKNVYVPMVSDKRVNSMCHLATSLTLAPNSCYVAMAKIKSGHDPGIYLVQSINSGIIDNQPGIEFSDAVIKINESRKIPVSITNYTNRSIRLKRGTVVGKLFNLTEDHEVHSVNSLSQTGFKSHGDRREQISPTTQEIKVQIHTENEYKDLVENLVLDNIDIFAFKDSEVPVSDLVSIKIELTDNRPFKIRQYKLSPADQQSVDRAVKEWEASGIIARLRGQYSSPLLVVGKKDGSRRVCCDFRHLNARTKPYVYPLASIDEILGKIGGSNYISTFDLKSGFFAVGIEPNSRDYTAFTCSKGQYHFKRALLHLGYAILPAGFVS